MASKLQRVKTLAADFVEEAPQVVTQEKRTGKPVMVNKVIQITQEQHQFLKRLKAETAIPGNVFFRQLLNEYIEKYLNNKINLNDSFENPIESKINGEILNFLNNAFIWRKIKTHSYKLIFL